MKPTSRPDRRNSALLAALMSLAAAITPACAAESLPHLGIDLNGNRISDIFEALYPQQTNPAGDSDGDGVSNEREAAAGTNPGSGVDFLKVSALRVEGGQVVASWASVGGKGYQLQSAPLPGGPWTNAGAGVAGTGGTVSASVPAGESRLFLRVQVSDLDSDDDGVTDWEELKTGTSPYLFDTDGDGRSDRPFVESRMGAPSTVNIFPLKSWGRETGPETAQFRITRHGGFMPLTVSFASSGTATSGSDYLLSAKSVIIPAGVMEAIVTVTPQADAELEPAETVTLTLQPGAYQIGSSPAASVTILGEGLNGQYYNTAGTPYENVLNFDPAALALTRRDPGINFNWSKPAGTPPGTGTGVPDPLILDDDVWSVRWTGMLYPKVTGVHQIHAIADRGVVVWVSRTPITAAAGSTTGARINVWTTTNPTTKYSAGLLSGSVSVTAGEPLYFRVDYRDTAGFPENAGIQLLWSAPGLPEEPIPASAFSTESVGGLAPVITSPLTAGAIIGAPFTWQITASNAPQSYSVSGLPSGLNVDASGLISGVVNAPAGYYPLTVTAQNAAGSDSKQVILYVTSTGGAATRDVWTGVTGTGLNAIPLHTAPAVSSPVALLEAPDNTGDGFGERIRGYITAPATGLFTFFLTSDELAELWISAGEEPARRLKRAWVSGAGIADGVWDAQPGQKSITMRMTAGRRYYFEVLRRESSGSDHLAVAWLKPGQTDPAQKEVIPGWALTPYTSPDAADPEGTLYAATLTPPPGSFSLASGSALLLVNEAQTEARLSFSFSNLSGPANGGVSVRDARSIQGQTGRVLFDVDAAEPDVLGNYTWTFADIGSHSAAEIAAAVTGGHAYLEMSTAAFPGGEVKGTFYPVAGSQFFIPPGPPVAAELTIPADPVAAKQEIVRFLQQATFGARHDSDGAAPWDVDSIEAVQQLGYAGWIDAQLALPAGPDPETVNLIAMPPTVVYATPASGRTTPNALVNTYSGSGPLCSYVSEYYSRYSRTSTDTNQSSQSSDEIWRAWWASSVKAQDQLRHRMAFALSQILVISEDGELDENARAVAHYYDLLYYHGLGNFRTLLERVTLNPSMGIYLDMLGNRKPNPSSGYIPNENFAREILQLFSIGLMRLHPDGSAVFSLEGLPLATYEQDNVVGFAHTFTGWNYPGSSNDKITAMTPRASDHDTGAKLLLEEAMLPAVTPATVDSCNAELAAALDIIFHHPNTAPFICRQLIQRLVTANPSPGYIYRVASVFENDGTGVRGNLAAVARAILLDPEARNQVPRSQPGFGHLKEPVIRATQMLRAFKGFSYAERNSGSTVDLGSVICATQANIDLTQPLPLTDFTIGTAVTPYTVVDGFVLAAGNDILVKSQTNPAENGIYRFSGNGQPLTRTPTADEPAEVALAYIRVTAGTNAGKTFRQTATVNTVGTDAQTWIEQAAANPRRRLWGMGVTSSLSQTPMRSPTVFNFYEPYYVYLGNTGQSGLYAPEFQITTETSVISAASWFYDFTRHNTSNPSEPFSAGQGTDHGDPIKRDIKLDLTIERSIASDSGALVDRVAGLIMPGMLDARLRTLLVNYLETLPEATDSDRMKRIGEALYLISLTPEFSWQK